MKGKAGKGNAQPMHLSRREVKEYEMDGRKYEGVVFDVYGCMYTPPVFHLKKEILFYYYCYSGVKMKKKASKLKQTSKRTVMRIIITG